MTGSGRIVGALFGICILAIILSFTTHLGGPKEAPPDMPSVSSHVESPIVQKIPSILNKQEMAEDHIVRLVAAMEKMSKILKEDRERINELDRRLTEVEHTAQVWLDAVNKRKANDLKTQKNQKWTNK